jgi:hypothetical protein
VAEKIAMELIGTGMKPSGRGGVNARVNAARYMPGVTPFL